MSNLHLYDGKCNGVLMRFVERPATGFIQTFIMISLACTIKASGDDSREDSIYFMIIRLYEHVYG